MKLGFDSLDVELELGNGDKKDKDSKYKESGKVSRWKNLGSKSKSTSRIHPQSPGKMCVRYRVLLLVVL